MDNMQFAYQKKRSTEDAIILLLHLIISHLENPASYVRCLFIDYSSAFNTIVPTRYIQKLSDMGVPTALQLWSWNFLTARTQQVRVNGTLSDVRTTNVGAPQGCVYSPKAFVLYTNDLTSSSQSCHIIKYADDTVLVGLISQNDEREYRSEICRIGEWCDGNRLVLNPAKCQELVFSFLKSISDFEPIEIDNKTVSFGDSFKYLGVTIQNNLKWDEHFSRVACKCNKSLYHLRTLHNLGVSDEVLRLFYFSTIQSVICYAIICVYHQASKTAFMPVSRIIENVMNMVRLELNLEKHVSNKSLKYLEKVLEDNTHCMFKYFIKSRRSARLIAPIQRTQRFGHSFVPNVIRLYNQN